jgi:hypothetical protein
LLLEVILTQRRKTLAWITCFDLTAWLTDVLQKDTVRAEFKELRARHADSAEYLEAIVRNAPAEVAATARLEMNELPAYFIDVIVGAWEVADAAGKPLSVVSQRPSSPLQFARDRRVGINVEASNDELRIAVQHVATRHADWYKPVAV